MNLLQDDQFYMLRALALAAQGRYTTSPNPNVGAVIVNEGVIVGEGFHREAGGPHAEVFALQQAGSRSRGATCYVTLEPCSHYGRTPPCALALIEAGIKRLVVAMQDPNPLVSGRGIAMLRNAGIDVEVGLCQAQAQALNPGFLCKMQQQRPYIRLKLAASLDGGVALAQGQSQWLTGPEAREDVQLQRAQACAILTTAQSVLTDQARMNVRSAAVTPLSSGHIRQPLRIVLDRQARLTGQEPLFQEGGEILLIHSHTQDLKPLQEPQCQVNRVVLPVNQQHRFELKEIMRLLSTMPLHTLWVEAGATLASEFWSEQLIDEWVIYQAPLLLGQGCQPLLQLPQLDSLANAPRWQWQDVRQIGTDVRLIARLKEVI